MVVSIHWCWGATPAELKSVMDRLRRKYGPDNVVLQETSWAKIKRRRSEKSDGKLIDDPLPRLKGSHGKKHVGVLIVQSG